MTPRRRPIVALWLTLVAFLAVTLLAACPETKQRPRPQKPSTRHKRKPVIRKSAPAQTPHPSHEHPHPHPHTDSDHHHHPHPHPHLAGPNGHHHPY